MQGIQYPKQIFAHSQEDHSQEDNNSWLYRGPRLDQCTLGVGKKVVAT